MAHPQAAEGDDLQIWRTVVNVLNNQLQTAERDGPPAWGLDGGLTTTHYKKNSILHRVRGFNRFFRPN